MKKSLKNNTGKMKKVAIMLMFASFISYGMTNKFSPITNNAQTTVYVCGKSKIYHNSKTHSALSRCKSGITKMTESKAKGVGKRACKCKN